MESIDNFSYNQLFYGLYSVRYISPKTGKVFSTVTTASYLIDAVFNSDDVKQKDLKALKKHIKVRMKNPYNHV